VRRVQLKAECAGAAGSVDVGSGRMAVRAAAGMKECQAVQMQLEE
jgi:hypothetical protein